MFIKLLSSLEKVFPDKKPCAKAHSAQSCLKGEFVNFQIAVFKDVNMKSEVSISVDSILETNIYKVKCMPSDLPCYGINRDENYLSFAPGLYPDMLEPVDKSFEILGGQWQSVWVEVLPTQTSGNFDISIKLDDEIVGFKLDVIDAELPKQDLLYTQWFHYDCLASYYKVPVFSDKHWGIIDNFQKNQSKYGTNMILTPVLTPPLDTVVGGQRPTVQLVDIEVKDGKYIYGYSKLEKFIEMSTKNGYTHFEISHPFTQWGAKFAPKVMADVGGEYKQIFGWETLATSDEYTAFIRSFVVNLKAKLQDLGVFENCYFHISDEPTNEHLESYESAVNVLKDIYSDCKVMDALSSFEFYKKGLVPNPVPANDHIDAFIENNVPNLWTYYCCSQNIDVSNKFFAMPSARNRIIATQLYKYDIVGFLHWGFNFYYSQYSIKEINPYCTTDAGGAFPSGDAFSVYPSEKGTALPSLRQFVFMEALQDLRAFNFLESLCGKEIVMNLIEESGKITFKKYPKTADYILSLREKVNSLIAEKVDVN